MSAPAYAPIDALARCPGQVYDDELVTVRRVAAAAHAVGELAVGRGADGRWSLEHTFTREHLDDDLAEQLAAALAPVTDSHEAFSRAFTGIVLTTCDDPVEAWMQFYRNNSVRTLDPARPGYAAVYRHALELLPRTSVLDLGCGFGFLSLRLAALGVDVSAADVDEGSLRLLRLAAQRSGHPVSIRHTGPSGGRVEPSSVDAVAMLHVLEHLEADAADVLLRDALRVARNRVVVAVPFEDTPTHLYGHVRAFDAAELDRLGRSTGWRYEVHEHVGGWLVLDR